MINKMPKEVQEELIFLKATTTSDYYLNKVELCKSIFIDENLDGVSRWHIYNAYLMTSLIDKIKNEDLKREAFDMIESCEESL